MLIHSHKSRLQFSHYLSSWNRRACWSAGKYWRLFVLFVQFGFHFQPLVSTSTGIGVFRNSIRYRNCNAKQLWPTQTSGIFFYFLIENWSTTERTYGAVFRCNCNARTRNVLIESAFRQKSTATLQHRNNASKQAPACPCTMRSLFPALCEPRWRWIIAQDTSRCRRDRDMIAVMWQRDGGPCKCEYIAIVAAEIICHRVDCWIPAPPTRPTVWRAAICTAAPSRLSHTNNYHRDPNRRSA